MNISAKKTTQKNVSSLTKPFLANLYQQARKPISNMSVDAAQCYDRANHVIMSLVWCSFIGVICSIGVLCRHWSSIKEHAMETHRALWVDMDVISWDWIKVVLGGCRPDHTIRRRGHDIGSSNGQWARQTGTRNDPGTKYGQRTDRGARCGSACRARASTRHTTYCHIDIGPDQMTGKLPAIGHATCCGRGEESAPPIHPFQCLML